MPLLLARIELALVSDTLALGGAAALIAIQNHSDRRELKRNHCWYLGPAIS
jgi:hypothetical protein